MADRTRSEGGSIIWFRLNLRNGSLACILHYHSLKMETPIWVNKYVMHGLLHEKTDVVSFCQQNKTGPEYFLHLLPFCLVFLFFGKKRDRDLVNVECVEIYLILLGTSLYMWHTVWQYITNPPGLRLSSRRAGTERCGRRLPPGWAGK